MPAPAVRNPPVGKRLHVIFKYPMQMSVKKLCQQDGQMGLTTCSASAGGQTGAGLCSLRGLRSEGSLPADCDVSMQPSPLAAHPGQAFGQPDVP